VKEEHPIHLVSKRTGLSPHVIRAWERRYSAVTPGRSGSNRRRYSGEEVERLQLLGILTRSGHRIGDIASLPIEVLRERAAEAQPDPPAAAGQTAPLETGDTFAGAVDAVRRMDGAALAAILERCSVALGQRGFLLRFVSPFAHRIGELWADGTLTAAHEHFASNELRAFLLRGSHAFAESASAPLAIVTTPARQLHELGAAIVAAAARDLGWRVLYLGPNLPAADIANAAVANKARLVALSIVYPSDDPALAGELAQLRRLLPAEIALVAGGVAAAANVDSLRTAGVPAMDDLEAFSRHLVQLRNHLSG